MKQAIKIKAKRLITSAISTIMCLSIVSSTAFAETMPNSSNLTSAKNSVLLETSDSNIYVTIEECRAAGEKWIAANYPEGTEIRDIIPIKNLNDDFTGYCINFSTNGVPAGHLALDANKFADDHILEFSFDGNGLYAELSEYTPAVASRMTEEKVIYATSPFEYAIKYTDGDRTMFYNENSQILSYAEEIERYEIVTFSDFSDVTNASVLSSTGDFRDDDFFWGSSLTDYTASNNVVIPGADSFVPYTMSTLRNGNNTGNCAPTAITNLCCYLADKRGKTALRKSTTAKTYSAVVAALGFKETLATDGSETYEGPGWSDIRNGISTYVKSCGYNVKVGDYWFDWWSDFTRDFDDGYPVIVGVQGHVIIDGKSTTAGHAIVGVGYRVLTNGNRYIRVYDGWTSSNSRFVSFDRISLTRIDGAFVDVTS